MMPFGRKPLAPSVPMKPMVKPAVDPAKLRAAVLAKLKGAAPKKGPC